MAQSSAKRPELRTDWRLGPLVTAALIALHFIAAQEWPSLRAVTSLLLLAVAFSAYRGGVRGGVVSGFMAFLYLTYDYSGNRFFEYTHVDLERMFSLVLVIPGIVALVHALRLKADAQAEAARAKEVEESARSLEQVSSSIAHDLRGSLVRILRFTDLLGGEDAANLAPLQRQFLGRIRANGAQMDRLIEDLLRYTDLHQRSTQLVPVRIEPILERVVSDLRPAMEEAHAEVCVDGPLPEVWGDPDTIADILSNLVSNALKFRREAVAARVTVFGGKTEEGPRISVRDNGIGIAGEHRGRLFRVFERLNADQAYPGTGIGLAIVAKSMQRMKGRVGVESEPGKGSTFWLQFSRQR